MSTKLSAPSAIRKLTLLFFIAVFGFSGKAEVFTLGPSDWNTIRPTYFSSVPVGGDTIRILSSRTLSLKFYDLLGSPDAPIVIINYGGRVVIEDTVTWGALAFDNCRYIKVSGNGVDSIHYGFSLRGATAGLAFNGYSSDCEAEFLEIHHNGFFGIVAKKDFSGNPPTPYPQFTNLILHDNYIHHQSEGIYVGETISPGMEFRHVRIYNNVVTDCIREAIQVANCVEDLELYNNFCFNTGIGGLLYQEGSLQIGDNTIGRYYNNIIMNCPGIGVPLMGSGDIELFGNYVANTGGIFIDDRIYSNIPSAISLYGNYFYNTHAEQVVSSMNSENEIHLVNNFYNTPATFAFNHDITVPLWDESGNLLTQVDTVAYSLTDGVFALLSGNPAGYNNMGPKAGLGHAMNSTPVIETPVPQYVLFGDSLDYTVQVTTADNDFLTFEIRDLPAFIQTEQPGNGLLRFRGLSTPEHKGVYYPVILVHDNSHNAFARTRIKIAFMDPLNTDPVLPILSSYAMEAASKLLLDITTVDIDGDSIEYTITNLPAFATFEQNSGSALIDIKPLLADNGNYNFRVIADDGFGNPYAVDVSLTVSPPALTPGRILYRINYGGPELADNDLNWQIDKNRMPVYGVNMAYGTGSHKWKGTNLTGAPNTLFGPYRHCFMEDTTFSLLFPLPTNGLYELNLYFAEHYPAVANNLTETFRVTVEDSIVLDSFNIYRDHGYHAVKKTFLVSVDDQSLNVDLFEQVNDAKINGVEIRFLEAANNPPVISGISDFLLNEATSDTLAFSLSDDHFTGCDTLMVSLLNAPPFLQLLQSGGNYLLLFTPGYSDAGVYPNVAIMAQDGCSSSEVNFMITVTDVFENHPPVLGSLTPVTLNEGTTENSLFSATDADNQALTFSFIDLPSFAQFVSLSNGQGKLVITPGYSDAGNYSVIIVVTDTYQVTDYDTLFISVTNSPVIERIPLNASMITDLVRPPYGSWQSAAYLVDEQNLSPIMNQHPTSLSWKPYYNINFSPYHVYLDLGQEYVITKVYVHDMNNVANLVFSYGTPDSWNDWFTEPCNGYVHWKPHVTNVTTRYIRISEYNTISAYANEIALYGYAVEEKSAIVIKDETAQVKIYPNPASDRIYIDGLPAGANVYFYDMTGRLVVSDHQSSIDLSSVHSGIYNLIVVGSNGELIHSGRLVVE